MKKLWNLVDRTSWMAERKYRVCVWVLAVVGALLGAVLWLAVSRVALGTPDWLLAVPLCGIVMLREKRGHFCALIYTPAKKSG